MRRLILSLVAIVILIPSVLYADVLGTFRGTLTNTNQTFTTNWDNPGVAVNFFGRSLDPFTEIGEVAFIPTFIMPPDLDTKPIIVSKMILTSVNPPEGPPILYIEASGVFNASFNELMSGAIFNAAHNVSLFETQLTNIPTNVRYTLDGTIQCINCPGGIPSEFLNIVSVNGFQSTPTPEGTKVSISSTPVFFDATTQTERSLDINVDFDHVTTGGATTIVASTSSAAVFSFGFQALPIPIYFDVTSTAMFSGLAEICVSYKDDNDDDIVDGTSTSVDDLRILHDEGGSFVNRTSKIDKRAKQVCAKVDSFSEFAVGRCTICPVIENTVIAGKQLSMRERQGHPNNSRFDIRSSSLGTLTCLQNGNLCDPTLYGGTLNVVSVPGGFETSYNLPPDNWALIGKSGENKGYKYRDKYLAAGPINTATIKLTGKTKTIRVSGRGSKLVQNLAVDPSPVDVKISLRNSNLCLSFGGITSFKENTSFKAKDSSAPANCE